MKLRIGKWIQKNRRIRVFSYEMTAIRRKWRGNWLKAIETHQIHWLRREDSEIRERCRGWNRRWKETALRKRSADQRFGCCCGTPIPEFLSPFLLPLASVLPMGILCTFPSDASGWSSTRVLQTTSCEGQWLNEVGPTFLVDPDPSNYSWVVTWDRPSLVEAMDVACLGPCSGFRNEVLDSSGHVPYRGYSILMTCGLASR